MRRPLPLLADATAQLKFGVEYAIAHFLLDHDAITVVQVGANDGQTHDPIGTLLRRKPSRGILLEPQPRAFERLKSTYKENRHLSVVNAAISDTDERRTLYCLSSDAPGPPWIHGLASFDRMHLLKHDGWVQDIRKYIEEVEVECVTFDTLFRRVPIGHVDLLQIDTEGFDADVLRLFDVPARRPSIINFEHRHLSTAAWNGCVEMLVSLGYSVAVVEQDTLAYLVQG